MRRFTATIVLSLLATAACHTDSKPAAPASKAPANVQSQVDHGGTVFAANCAECHGASGQGGKGPRLVGAGAFPLNPRPEQKVRKIRFHTAADVAKFVTTSMPPDPEVRKEIPESDYWAVLAFALSANGVKLQAPVGPGNAASIVLNP
jgi:cytochrome c